MNMLEIDPQNLSDVYHLYLQEVRQTNSESKGYSLAAKLKTALIRYTLPGWGFSTGLNEPKNNQVMEEGLQFMKKITLQNLTQALAVQEMVYSTLGDTVSGASKRTYRSALKQMLDWCQDQVWWKRTVSFHSEHHTPRMKPSPRKPREVCPLKLHHLPPKLHQELEELCQFYFSK